MNLQRIDVHQLHNVMDFLLLSTYKHHNKDEYLIVANKILDILLTNIKNGGYTIYDKAKVHLKNYLKRLLF